MSQEILNEEIIVKQEKQEEIPALIKFEIEAALLIEEFLKDKQKDEDDSLNIDLFLSGDLSGWRFKYVPAPSLEDLRALESQVSLKQLQKKINAEAQAFLDATDWMVIRAMEKGEELSPELKAERQAARDRIVK